MNVNGVAYVFKLEECGESIAVYKERDTFVDKANKRWRKSGAEPVTTIPFELNYLEVGRAVITAIDAIEKARQTTKNVIKEELLLNVA